jgi:hypothetical protein
LIILIILGESTSYEAPHYAVFSNLLDKRAKVKEIGMRFGARNVRSAYRAGSLRKVGGEISKYKSDLVEVQEARWDRGGTEPTGYGKGNEKHELGTGFLYITKSYQQFLNNVRTNRPQIVLKVFTSCRPLQ